MNLETIKQELQEYINDEKSNYNDVDINDLHYHLFNQDYYIIGYYNAEQWLKKHNINIFQGISFVQDYEREMFGNDGMRNYDNAESLVNMIVYIIGEELLYENQKV
jgi:hypothetical protein